MSSAVRIAATGGKRQRFCCAAHRSRFWRALRTWASRVFDAGLISIDDLRRPYDNVHAALDAEKTETRGFTACRSDAYQQTRKNPR